MRIQAIAGTTKKLNSRTERIGGMNMKGYLFSTLIVFIIAIIGVTPPIAKSDCTEPIPELFQRVSPSVVSILSLAMDPFKIANQVSKAVGSGFIINNEGLVLTNSHVVFGRQVIIVTLYNGRKIEAELLGADPISDLAVLRIPVPSERYPTAVLGNSDSVRIGEDVIAIGNPFGLEQTLTRGVISGINRIMPGSPPLTLPFIQTDASINAGNSGGPLMNRCGEVIGINTSILAEAQNIGFSIPINVAKNFIPDLLKHGRVIRPWLGVSGKPVKKELMEIINLPLVDGFLIETIDPGSPAQKEGIHGGGLPLTIAGTEFLLGGDIITEINGEPLDYSENSLKLLGSLKAGDRVRLTLFYRGETRSIELNLTERPILPGDLRSSASGTLLPMRKAI
jgi:S1-C subfamily serine protease